MVQRLLRLIACIFVFAGIANAQANGKLQIHHMDVGQGDGAVLISPGGEVVVFDVSEDMKKRDCTKPVSYLDQLGIKQIDYLYASHYHFDHVGCIPAVLEQVQPKGVIAFACLAAKPLSVSPTVFRVSVAACRGEMHFILIGTLKPRFVEPHPI